MAVRIDPLYTNEYYHVFNKSIRHLIVFTKKQQYQHFLKLILYYRSNKAVRSYSHFQKCPLIVQKYMLKELKRVTHYLVEIHSFCLMPTHFHFLLRQKQCDGTQRFIGNVVNAYTRYRNIQNRSKGPLFLPRFKAVRIHTTIQYKHVSRYIHLNPYTAGLVQTIQDLENYPWSSYKEYLRKTDNNICVTKTMHKMFSSKEKYRNFINDRADYQKNLERLKYIDC